MRRLAGKATGVTQITQIGEGLRVLALQATKGRAQEFKKFLQMQATKVERKGSSHTDYTDNTDNLGEIERMREMTPYRKKKHPRRSAGKAMNRRASLGVRLDFRIQPW